MKKAFPILIIVVVLIVITSILLNIKHVKTVDWEESFNEKSNKPYGTSILYKELPKLFKNYKIRTVYHQPASYLQAHANTNHGQFIAKGSFLIIGNSNYLEDNSIDELLNFVNKGNTLFISDYKFPKKLQDSLGIETKYIKNNKDSISTLSLKYIKLNHITIDKNLGDFYFHRYNKSKHHVLGHSKIKYQHPNFIKIPLGKGFIFLHTEPKAFTNYNLLKDNRYQYIEGVLSYLPENDVFYDSFSKIQTPYSNNIEKESNLSWFLKQKSFKWAWYTALIFTLLFMLFNAKRRQRIIKTITPLQNTTVAFVKTVSNLYFETKDHKNLIDKKITYFLEKIRTQFNLNTTLLNDEFIEKLAIKTNKKTDNIKPLINYINWLKTQQAPSEAQLIKLNKLIEAFYSK